MNCFRFWGKKRPREQSKTKNRNVQQQKVEEATGNIPKNEVEKALQKNDVIELEEYQKLVNALQTKIVGLEENQQALQKLVAALSEKAAKCVGGERVEQIELELKEETNRKLEELRNNSLDAIEKGELIAKMEQQQQTIIDALTEAQKGNVEHFSLLRTKIDELERKQKANQKEHRAKIDEGINQLKGELFAKMEQYPKELQQNIDALTEAQQGNGLMPEQNQWDSTACHEELTLSGPDQLIVHYTGKNWGKNCSVLAKRPMPKKNFGNSYYEVTILEKACDVSIGLATKEMPLDGWVGFEEGTYAYASNGTFMGHEVEEWSPLSAHPFIEHGIPEFGVGDVIGCGVDWQLAKLFIQRMGSDGKLPVCLSPILPPNCFRAFRCMTRAT
uniref:B30.2/SPRY domain-containing protein n=1 Tax=Globodera pallida TaxID=36090 RepID=A0A183BPY2_GLOPA